MSDGAIVLPAHPALLVIDMQNGFIEPEGFFARTGLDPSAGVAAIAPIQRLLAAARAAGLPVVFTRYTLNADYSDAGQLVELVPAIRGSGGMVRDTWDAALISALEVAPGELVLDKTRYSAFFGTDLKDWLDERGVDGVILCGVTTNVCVEGTGRDAFAHDYAVSLVSDATGAATTELHEAALLSARYGMGQVVTTDQVVTALEAR
jgi:ureidoacrylate peracid hydrolase